MQPLKKCVFLDKDGTLIRDVPYNVDPGLVTLEPGVIEGLARMQAQGYLLVIITNQPGIGMRLFSENQLGYLIRHLRIMFLQSGIRLDGFYYCPHLPKEINSDEDHCTCRKPEPGLIVEAAAKLGIDLNASWMIGDILNDIEAGKRAGCKTILINNGNETEWVLSPMRTPEYTAANFTEATDLICGPKVKAYV